MRIRHLENFVHMSTAYVSSPEEFIPELALTPDFNPVELLKQINSEEDIDLNQLFEGTENS